MLTPETLARLEAAARKQIGHEMSTGVTVTPGELLELVNGYRNPYPTTPSDEHPDLQASGHE